SRTGTRRAQQDVRKRGDPAGVAIGEAGSKKIRGYVVVHVHAIGATHVIGAEIGDTAQPVPEMIGRRSTASGEIESANPGSGRVGTKIGIADGRIYLSKLSRMGTSSRKRKNSSRRHIHNEVND